MFGLRAQEKVPMYFKKVSFLLGIFFVFSFLFLSTDKALAVAPTISSVKYNGNLIAVTFDQNVFTDNSAGVLVAGDFTLAGSTGSGRSIVEVTHSTVTSTNIAIVRVSGAAISTGGAGVWTIAAAAGQIFNSLGEANGATAVDLNGTADAVVPTISALGPPNNQQNVSIDAFIDFTLNEAIMASTTLAAYMTLQANTGNTQIGAPAGANLCRNTAVFPDNRSRARCEIFGFGGAPLATSTWYTFTVTTNITDTVGNALAAASSTVFRTGTFDANNNVTPPTIVSSVPAIGSQTFPINGNIFIMFPLSTGGVMSTSGAGSVVSTNNVVLQTTSAGAPSGANLCASDGCTLTWDGTARKLTINPAANLTASTEYALTMRNTITNTNSIPLNGGGPDYRLFFRTGAAADSSQPEFINMVPAQGSTGVQRSLSEVVVTFSKEMDTARLSTTTVRFFRDADSSGTENDGDTVYNTDNVNLFYDQMQRGLHIGLKFLLAQNARYCVRIPTAASGGTLPASDTMGNALSALGVTTRCFTSVNQTYNAVAPTVQYAEADNFKLWIRFDQPINATDATTTANFAIESPLNTLVNLANATLTYRAEASSVEITGLGLTTGQEFRVTVTNVRDMSGLATTTANGTTNVARGTVLDAARTGARPIGGFETTDFSQRDQGALRERPQQCAPRSLLANAETSLDCTFSTATALTTGAQLILTFPAGFGVGLVTSTPTFTSFINRDLNGQGPGTTFVSAVSSSTVARTVTLTLNHSGTAMVANDQLHFELSGLVTASSTGSQTMSIIVKNAAGSLLETISPAPFMLQQPGGFSMAGRICRGSTSGGRCEGGDTAIGSVTVFMESRGGFGTGGIMAGRQQTTTNGSGDYTFSGLSAGQYGVGIFADPATFGDIGGGLSFQEVTVSSTARTGIDFKFASLGGAGGVTVTTTVTGAPASTDMDIFCMAPGSAEFSAPIVKKITSNSAGIATTTVRLKQNTNFECGLGPAIPREALQAGGPPPIPEFTFMPPPPQTIITTSTDRNLNFTLLTTDYQIIGKVVDGSNGGIANVFVDAFPSGGKGLDGSGNVMAMGGSFAQTKSDGSFVLRVVRGTYRVNACAPGMACGTPTEVTVVANTAAVDNNATADVSQNGTLLTGDGLSIGMAKTGLTIAGQLQDENGNAIQYGFVHAEQVGASDTCTSFTTNGVFVGSPTDSSGNYTLYVQAGTWRVQGNAGAYGDVACTIVTVTSSSASGKDLRATAADFGTIQGTVLKNNAATQGAKIHCFSPTVGGGNGTVSGSDGSFSLKVKAGAGYSCRGFLPGGGDLTPVTGITVAAAGTNNITLSMGNPGSITVTLGSTVTDAFCDARDSSGLGFGTGLNSSGTYTLYVPPGTYTVRCNNPSLGLIGSQSVTVDAGEAEAVTLTPGTLYTVSGRVTDGSSNLAGAGVNFTNRVNGNSIIISSSGASGSNANVSVTLPAGTYGVRATKDGYIDSSTAEIITVSADASFTTRSLTRATASVSFTVQLDGANYTGDAAVIATDSSNNTLVQGVNKTATTTANAIMSFPNGTWTVRAKSRAGKQSAATTITVTSGTPSPTTATLSLSESISGFTATEVSRQAMTPATGGIIQDTTCGSGFEVNIPEGVLSTTDETAGSVEIQKNPEFAVSTAGKTIVGSSACEITPKNSSGSEISDLTSDAAGATIKLPYSDADVTAAGLSDASKLVLAVWDETMGDWEPLATTVDTVNRVLTAQTKHFSAFAPIAPTDAGAPATPSFSALTSLGTTEVRLNWTAVSGATGYDIYRDTNINGSFARRGSDPTVGAVTTYNDSGLTSNTTYYYKISSINTAGESAASAASAVTTDSSGGGATPPSTTPAPQSTPAPTTPSPTPTTPTPTPTPTPTTPTEVSTTPAAEPGPNAVSPTRLVKYSDSPKVYAIEDGARRWIPTETAFIGLGFNWDDIEVIEDTEVIAEGENLNFTPETERPEGRLVRSSDDPAVYLVDNNGERRVIPTEKDFNGFGFSWTNVEVVNNLTDYPEGNRLVYVATGASEIGEGTLIKYIDDPKVYVVENGVKRWIPSESDFLGLGYSWGAIIPVSRDIDFPEGEDKINLGLTIKSFLSAGSQGDEVKALQQKLKTLGFFTLEPNGNFGPHTQQAVQAFQRANSLPTVGYVGPQTRALLNR